MKTKDHEHLVIKAITEKAKSIVPPHSKVILFGSRARGDARQDSDWDVLILLDKDSVTLDDIDEFTYPLREMGWDYNECINTVLSTKKDWDHDIASPFNQNVNREGVVLWD